MAGSSRRKPAGGIGFLAKLGLGHELEEEEAEFVPVRPTDVVKGLRDKASLVNEAEPDTVEEKGELFAESDGNRIVFSVWDNGGQRIFQVFNDSWPRSRLLSSEVIRLTDKKQFAVRLRDRSGDFCDCQSWGHDTIRSTKTHRRVCQQQRPYDV